MRKLKLELQLEIPCENRDELRVKSYYARFWGLKSDQFDYWLADVVDIETFSNWCFMTMKAFCDVSDEGSPKEYDYEWGWNNVGVPDHRTANPWFYEFTESLKELGALWTKSVSSVGCNQKKEDIWQHLLFEVIDVLAIVHKESNLYRKHILDGMTITQYRESLHKQTLGLSVEARGSDIEERLKTMLNNV
jgi:hypothetical protein